MNSNPRQSPRVGGQRRRADKTTKENAMVRTLLERKRGQSRKSTRRWRTNEQVYVVQPFLAHLIASLISLLQMILGTLTMQVQQLEAELKINVFVVGTEPQRLTTAPSANAGHDHRLDHLLA
ncbi:hypothetical protein H310_00052 [Aphanomyces invadans]|uniref:Uncharacterized protein n=1 Tax=Aphanomyces invadans TaxID=157072 RepID=A0A024UU76_9STRA|nr:hypothetical protein H310_00052 [Aphanomyces invadans]ETW09462.1 hypothetical protein H310_00052 [Aphanomyces invadans]|eukprot:XP_008860873.1 hypothetical protein H310_00052 [Aphanomyces invadans]